MSLTAEERQIMVSLEYEKALRFLNQARKNAEIEEWDASIHSYRRCVRRLTTTATGRQQRT